MKRITLVVSVVLVLIGVLIIPANAAPPKSGPVYHYVKWGENLTRIAMHYGTTAWSIAQINGIANPNLIYAGQVLVIYPGTGYQYPYNVYVVQWGDTLTSIAWRFGTSPWAIAQANGIYNLNYIYAGQRLIIPN
ncbi:MAG: LysM peptidoglycan-binding domain-containing protein [Chloroflexota bacterium]|nr:LysM peptidoglycan-binding domain-containing protein [Chloroflexota bacterium]